MMTPAELRRASELLQKNGEDIETCHTVAGEWLDEDDDMRAEVREHYDLARKLREEADAALTARALVAEQAEDEGLWFDAQTAPEAYLQQALRRLHAAVES